VSESEGILRRRLNDRRKVELSRPTSAVQHRPPSPEVLAARRFRRPAELVEAATRVDTAPSAQAQRDIAAWVQEVYEALGAGVPIGLFSHCYLGAPYVDHVLTMAGSIVEHFRAGDPVPPAYEAARPYAVSEQFAYIEIYSDGMVVPVRHDGTAAI
jgi:hypothetical protein